MINLRVEIMWLKTSVILFFLLISNYISAQNAEHTIYRYANGKIASEGYLLDGKPDGYWKTYYENGLLKSEGNRVNFLLEGTWIFYSDQGDTTLIVNYDQGKKNGLRKTFLSDEIIEEYFINDLTDNFTRHFDKHYRLLKKIPFMAGLESGTGFCYDTLNNIIELRNYKTGYLVSRESINRFDNAQKKHGVWKTFYENDQLHTEESYQHGLKNGVFKEYDKRGNIKSIKRFENGVEVDTQNEMNPLEYQRNYFNNGQVKTEATYRNGKLEGIKRDFNEDGSVAKSFMYNNGILISEGVLESDGQRQGFWKEYYNDGTLKSEGNYLNNKPVDKWKYYYKNQVIEQTGSYNQKGQLQGKWVWYFENGKVNREENYRRDRLDGLFIEFDTKGREIVRGEYIDGYKIGHWLEHQGKLKMEGDYSSGKKNGTWKSYFNDNKIAFEGAFIDGNENGEHRYYYPNGVLRESINFVMGKKQGENKKYLDDGTLFLSINFENGVEKAYDGVRLDDDVVIAEEGK